LHRFLYPRPRYTYTASEALVTPGFHSLSALRAIVAVCSCVAIGCSNLYAQEAAKKPAEQTTEKEKPAAVLENPAQIELFETHIRFETNGDSRKEIHTSVKINNELGARQFARLNFGYNRAFESVEIPFVHITHASGGSADILPSAISDQPNPAVVNAPAYQDVRIKSVRILGLEPGDQLEYRVVTMVTHHPLAPDFWMEHSFVRAGIVTKEIFELDLPVSSKVQLKFNPETPATSLFGDIGGVVFATRKGYRWERSGANEKTDVKESNPTEPDIVLTTYASWEQLTASRLAVFFGTTMVTPLEIEAKAAALTQGLSSPEARSGALYDFVSQKIRTIDLPLGATGFRTRDPVEILSSGYGTPEDKFVLFAALASKLVTIPRCAFVSSRTNDETLAFARPTAFDQIVALVEILSADIWLDLSLEVAPYGIIPSQFRGKRALLMIPGAGDHWRKIGMDLPFPAKQSVKIDASLGSDGTLTSKVHYTLRGDNELLLRIAFHQTPKERWKEVAQLLAFADGFRGKITNVQASDPYATKEPFSVEYEISQPKFVDWSKKPVRVPALLPQIGLPDVPAKPAAGKEMPPIELGTPLEVEAHAVLHLPSGTTARAPVGVAVSRDYATFASQYSANAKTLTATRHVNFLLRELPAERAVDYNSFRRAVQNDEAQDFTLERPDGGPAKTNWAAPDHAVPPKANPAKP
jgi:hypothetical protein